MNFKQTKYPHLFEPIKVGNTRLKTRITQAPKYDFSASYDNHLTRQSKENFMPIAKGGASIVTMGTGVINRVLPETAKCVPELNNVFDIPTLSEWSEGIKRYGAKASIELVPLSPTFGTHEVENSVGIPMEIDINVLTKEELQGFIQDYGNAAKIAMMAGFDFVTVHGAHCQLPALLFSPVFNKRTDEYGAQTFENRCRCAKEILAAIRRECGFGINIEYRISATDMVPDSPSIDEVVRFAQAIEEDVDLFLISRGNLAINNITPYIFPPTYMEHGINIKMASKFKKMLHKPVGVVGAVTFEQAEEAIAEGLVDTVAMTRQLLADPDCVNKAERGQAENIRPCIRCNVCINRPHFELRQPRCSVNPMLGRDADYAFAPPAKVRKQVVVIGGGPAGIEAACTAAERGHQVALYEKQSVLGGVFRGAGTAPFKQDLQKYLDWSIRRLSRYENLKINMSAEITPDSIRNMDADAIIYSGGNVPIIPKLTCQDPNRVVWAGDVDSGKSSVRDNVLIAGAGLTGLEAALRFLQEGKKVTIIDMLPEEQIGKGGSMINLYGLKNLLEDYKYTLLAETQLVDVTDSDIIVMNNGEKKNIKADTLVLSLGNRVNHDIIQEYRKIAPEFYAIGDANGNPGCLWNAVTSAFDAAMVL